ncbi:tRNA uridine(34) 5-carboxymethylaminomethyl modification radical SAM/GNAT enzyme Elp3 [Adlercreutzia sp. ZJ242]|uniref:elongator complex protein 3 n=1 Tax=Adlercreutzia sp. ZJ242 TaxID=2709409 RepID=UPI001F1544D9|nr:tRNA uridine(34) 5-carboxymethylaminomethyl modification radical SAM/GNAT enzyme Elp3 [Adlercreutzia sp. ZJ242]
MEVALLEIIAAVKAGGCQGLDGDGRPLDAAWLDKLVRRRNRAMHDGARSVAKKRLLPYYLRCKAEDPARWESWGVDAACEEQLVRLLKAKPRRTASGVATITVITKPHPCSSDCLYCPNDVRMPKSYLADEPACQRAERNYFDPYLQVTSRLRALTDMGHVTDKVELIVLGGTWSDYPQDYQIWFVTELFRALNDAGGQAGFSHGALREEGVAGVVARHDSAARHAAATCHDVAARHDAAARASFYASCGLACDADELARLTRAEQKRVTAGERTYNQAVRALYAQDAWERAACVQRASFAELEREHARNEGAAHRVVGLVIETRPDLVTPESLTVMRRLGCTKVQMGIQSLDESVLRANRRNVTPARIAQAFSLLRLFGFKIHVHFMVNLLGASPAGDAADYRRLVTDGRFLPDEVKLYPCCLVESAQLTERYAAGEWAPYPEDVLVGVLVEDVLATPAYTRISRMIRDISSGDIVAGNKKTNLRQLVEARVEERSRAEGRAVREIRQREIATGEVKLDALRLDCVAYATSVAQERFLQWVTPEGRIAGFLRLSLPRLDAPCLTPEERAQLPVHAGEAMIREVHVYGRVARLHAAGEGAQHAGLGRRLVEEACAQARAAGYVAVNVISSVGTRNYYRALGFSDCGLYQRRPLA